MGYFRKLIMTEQELIKKMQDILTEAMSIDDKLTYDNFYDKYSKAADQLYINYDEDDNGELDIYRTIYRLGTEFFDLKSGLKALLEFDGLNLEQRKNFYKKVFTRAKK